MKLLILTQKIDKDDFILGFFYTWVERLAEKFENIIVICLEKSEYDLPDSVKVFSLGKENGGNKISYAFKFFHLCFFSSLQYDSVFVHMNQEYVLLGGLFWKLLGKKIYFWRNHPLGNFFTRIAVWISDKIFCTSLHSFTARYRKTILMPVGIDTSRFQASNPKHQIPNSILSLGRISPVKNVHLMVEAAKILKRKDLEFVFNIIGDPVNPEDFEYKKKLEPEEAVNFLSAVPNYQTPEIYNNHQIFVNLTLNGSMDKTIFEAVACGCIPIVANEACGNIFDDQMITDGSSKDMAKKITYWLKTSDEEKSVVRDKIQKFVLKRHSLRALIDKLFKVLNSV